MSSQDNRDNSSSGAVNRRNILLVSTTLGVASALGSTTLAQITRAQAQTAQEPVHIYGGQCHVTSCRTAGPTLSRRTISSAVLPGEHCCASRQLHADYSGHAQGTLFSPATSDRRRGQACFAAYFRRTCDGNRGARARPVCRDLDQCVHDPRELSAQGGFAGLEPGTQV